MFPESHTIPSPGDLLSSYCTSVFTSPSGFLFHDSPSSPQEFTSLQRRTTGLPLMVSHYWLPFKPLSIASPEDPWLFCWKNRVLVISSFLSMTLDFVYVIPWNSLFYILKEDSFLPLLLILAQIYCKAFHIFDHLCCSSQSLCLFLR